MKLAANHRDSLPQHPSLEELRALIADETSADAGSQSAANHLDHCETCQSRLTDLAADASWWSDAQALLSGEHEPRWEPDASRTNVFADEGVEPAPAQDPLLETVRQLLGTPNHPEMLGRLGRYDIERVIGSGGMGIVMKAHDSELNRPIALKVLSPHLAHSGAARERFAREGRAAAAVVHEHVVAIYNVESDGKAPFLVMQYVPGRSLQTRVDEDGPLAVEEILRIGAQAASGLAAAHRQGLVHRDVKPANILLENQVDRAILTDFGLARAIDDASLTQTGILAGTPHYMSPEQATGEAIDFRSDLFSLGAVLYFMATGRPPFRAAGTLAVLHRLCHEKHRPAWQANSAVPDELSDVIDRLLEKKPGRRFASAEQVQQELAGLLSRAQQQGLGRRRFLRGRWRRLRRPVLAIVAVGLAMAFIAVAVDWFRPPTQASNAAAVGSAASTIDASDARRLDLEFFADLEAVQGTLNATANESYYLQHGIDPWSDDLQSLRRDLTDLESTDSFTD